MAELKELRRIAENTILRDLELTDSLKDRVLSYMRQRDGKSYRSRRRRILTFMSSTVLAVIAVGVVAFGISTYNEQRTTASSKTTFTTLQFQLLGTSITPITTRDVSKTIATLTYRLQGFQKNNSIKYTSLQIAQRRPGNFVSISIKLMPLHLSVKQIEETVVALSQQSNLQLFGNVTHSHGKVLPDIRSLLVTGDEWKSDAAVKMDSISSQETLQLTASDASQFERVTRHYLGKPIYLFFNGQLLSTPIVQSVISDGRMLLSIPTSMQKNLKYRQLAAQINGGYEPFKMDFINFSFNPPHN